MKPDFVDPKSGCNALHAVLKQRRSLDGFDHCVPLLDLGVNPNTQYVSFPLALALETFEMLL